MQEIAPFKKELRGGACPQTPLTTVRSIAARDLPHEKSYIRPVAYLNHTCICKQCNTPPLF